MAENLETVPMRRLLYQLGELLGDPALAAGSRSTGPPTSARSFDISGARGQVAIYQGRVREARRLFEETMKDGERPRAPAGGVRLRGAGGLRGGPLRLRPSAASNRRAASCDRRPRTSRSSAPRPRWRWAESRARPTRSSAGSAACGPHDTLLQNAYLPVVEAAALLARGQPAPPIEQLRRAAPYENGIVAALLPVYVRGEARLRAGAAAEAVREFQSILTHRGADPFSPVVALAHLGLARAHARTGAIAESRAAYESLFAIWSGADPDLPVLRKAREEYAALK